MIDPFFDGEVRAAVMFARCVHMIDDYIGWQNGAVGAVTSRLQSVELCCAFASASTMTLETRVSA